MINSRTIALAIFSSLIFFSGNAFAQNEVGGNCEKGPRGSRDGGEMAGAANTQGQVQRGGGGGGGANQGIGPEETATRMISNFDADGDGSLNMQELTNGLAALQQSMRQMQMQRGQQGQSGQQGDVQTRGRRGGGNQSQGQSSRQQRQGERGGQGLRGGGPSGQQRGGSGGSRRGR